MEQPSANGRKRNGTFAGGNPGGPGNPHSGQVAKLRSVLLKTVTEKSMRTIIKKLVLMAESGDLLAIKLLLDRTLGKVPSPEPSVAIQVNAVPNADESFGDRARRIVEERSNLTPEQQQAQRKEALHRAGFPAGANPSPREILNRMMEQRTDEQCQRTPQMTDEIRMLGKAAGQGG